MEMTNLLTKFTHIKTHQTYDLHKLNKKATVTEIRII